MVRLAMTASIRAQDAAAQGFSAVSETRVQDAAWLGLYATELDADCALAWALLAQILVEVTRDPLGTWLTHQLLDAETLKAPYLDRIARYHRIDLWTKGLYAHRSGGSLLKGAQLDDPAQFAATPRLAAWLDAQTAAWGGEASARRALAKMVAALSDAWVVPELASDPLMDDVPWAKRPAYEAFVAQDPLASPPETASETELDEADGDPQEEELVVLSDYWMEQEIVELGAQGKFDYAKTRAELWQNLRPTHLAPRLALLRLASAENDADAVEAHAEAIAEMDVEDLNALEDARLVLGQLQQWGPQIEVLDRMLTLAPGHPVILANLGAAKMQVGDDEEGAENLKAALNADPTCGPALANLALFYMRQEDYDTAQPLLERAVAAAPDEAQVHVYLGVCKNNQGREDEAVVALERALALDPSHEEARKLLDALKAGG